MLRDLLQGTVLLLLTMMSATIIACSHVAAEPTAPRTSQLLAAPAENVPAELPKGRKYSR